MLKLWVDCLKHLEREVSGSDFNLWLRPLQARESSDVLRLYAPNDFVYEAIVERYLARIESLVSHLSGGQRRLELTLGKAPSTQTREAAETVVVSITPEDDGGLDERYGFQNYVPGNSNKMAHAAALQAANNPGNRDVNPLLLYGGTGLGKTHLLHAIGLHQRTLRLSTRIRYVRSELFVQGFIQALRHETLEAFKSRYRDVDTLLIDDIQLLANKPSSQEEFFHTFNFLIERGRQIVLSCDRYPREVDGIEQRLSSRMGWGLSVPVEPPDYETRVAILASKAQSAGIEVPLDVLSLIARRMPGNVRELEGALHTLIANARFAGVEVSLDFAQQALRHLLTVRDRLISIQNIIKQVSDYYGISIQDVLSRSRSRAIVRPRQLAMALAKELTDHSLPELGKAFGGRDHTTVIHAVRTIDELKLTDGRLREDYDRLRRRLTT